MRHEFRCLTKNIFKNSDKLWLYILEVIFNEQKDSLFQASQNVKRSFLMYFLVDLSKS